MSEYQAQNDKINENKTNIRLIMEKIERIFDEIKRINEKLDHQYVSVVEFASIKVDFEKRVSKIESSHSKIAWFIILTVLGSLLALVIKQNI